MQRRPIFQLIDVRRSSFLIVSSVWLSLMCHFGGPPTHRAGRVPLRWLRRLAEPMTPFRRQHWLPELTAPLRRQGQPGRPDGSIRKPHQQPATCVRRPQNLQSQRRGQRSVASTDARLSQSVTRPLRRSSLGWTNLQAFLPSGRWAAWLQGADSADDLLPMRPSPAFGSDGAARCSEALSGMAARLLTRSSFVLPRA
jgi:hypothetical protein